MKAHQVDFFLKDKDNIGSLVVIVITGLLTRLFRMGSQATLTL